MFGIGALRGSNGCVFTFSAGAGMGFDLGVCCCRMRGEETIMSGLHMKGRYLIECALLLGVYDSVRQRWISARSGADSLVRGSNPLLGRLLRPVSGIGGRPAGPSPPYKCLFRQKSLKVTGNTEYVVPKSTRET